MSQLINFLGEYLWLIILALVFFSGFRKTKKKRQQEDDNGQQARTEQAPPPVVPAQSVGRQRRAPWDDDEEELPLPAPLKRWLDDKDGREEEKPFRRAEHPYAPSSPIPTARPLAAPPVNRPQPVYAPPAAATPVAPTVQDSNSQRPQAEARRAHQRTEGDLTVAAPMDPCSTPSSTIKLPPLTAQKMAEAMVLAEIIGPPRSRAIDRQRRAQG